MHIEETNTIKKDQLLNKNIMENIKRKAIIGKWKRYAKYVIIFNFSKINKWFLVKPHSKLISIESDPRSGRTSKTIINVKNPITLAAKDNGIILL